MNYYAYIKSPKWYALCQRTRDFWDNRCAVCYEPRPLEVHHRTYLRLGNELPTDVLPLCDECHEKLKRRYMPTVLFDPEFAELLKGVRY